MAVEELGEILELVKNGAGDADSKYQFVDVREEGELGKAKLDGKGAPLSMTGGGEVGLVAKVKYEVC